jgi:hypothetical protein
MAEGIDGSQSCTGGDDRANLEQQRARLVLLGWSNGDASGFGSRAS